MLLFLCRTHHLSHSVYTDLPKSLVRSYYKVSLQILNFRLFALIYELASNSPWTHQNQQNQQQLANRQFPA